jgi:hypothetical protein
MQKIITNNVLLKFDNMSELKLIQLKYETDTWKRLLGFMMEENNHQKTRLAEILKDKFNKNLLNEIEDFQTRFIKEDELIGLLRSDIAELDKLMAKERFENGKIIKEIDGNLKKIRAHINVAERQFSQLKTEFNSYLSENI